MRLVRGVRTEIGIAGRVEIFLTWDWMFHTGYLENDGWAPVCDDFSLSGKEVLVSSSNGVRGKELAAGERSRTHRPD